MECKYAKYTFLRTSMFSVSSKRKACSTQFRKNLNYMIFEFRLLSFFIPILCNYCFLN